MTRGPRGLLAGTEGTTQWVTRKLARFASRSTPQLRVEFRAAVATRVGRAARPERPDRADGTRREGDAERLDPGGGVVAVGWAQVGAPGARGVSRAGSARTPYHPF